MDQGRLRLFVAVPAPPVIQAVVAAAQTRLRSAGIGAAAVRWGDPALSHLTLQFLGATAPERVPGLSAVLGQIVVGPFRLDTGAFGGFPSVSRPRVLWLGVDGDRPALGSLRDAVVAATGSIGLGAERGPFAAHLTLGRTRDRASVAERSAVARAMAEVVAPAAQAWPVAEFCLVASETTPAGPRHRTLGRWTLRSRP